MTEPDPEPDARRAALARSLDEVRARIDAAARAAGRDPAEISLLAVTKTCPAADVAHLVDLGLADFGENKEQEGAAKKRAFIKDAREALSGAGIASGGGNNMVLSGSLRLGDQELEIVNGAIKQGKK